MTKNLKFFVIFLLYTLSAVNVNALSRNVSALVGAQKRYDSRAILGLAVKSDGNRVGHRFCLFGLGERFNVSVGVDNTGRNVIYGYSVSRKLQGE